MNDNRFDDDAKLDAFLRGNRPEVPPAPGDELALLLKAVAPPKRRRIRTSAPVWAAAFALVVLVAAWFITPYFNSNTQGSPVAETFALLVLTEPMREADDNFMLRDHPLSGLTEDQGEE